MDSLTLTKPKLGFAGVGWIGQDRLKAIWQDGPVQSMAVTDPNVSAIEELREEVPDFDAYESFEELADSDLDGIVIATPSALHASQAQAALEKGKAVFCQKPLGRNEKETAEVVQTASKQDLLLEVDFSYRYTKAVEEVKRVISSGELGTIYGARLTFHNAYGPDKSWYRDVDKAGGGCLMDLGIHLVDLLYWVLDDPKVTDVKGRLYHGGKPIKHGKGKVEDYVAAQLELDNHLSAQLSCSWNLPAGRDAIIEATFYGEQGGVSFRNIDGSFYDFVAEKFQGTSSETLVGPPDNWGGRAAVRWAEKLAEGQGYSADAETYTKVAQTLDHIYKNSSR